MRNSKQVRKGRVSHRKVFFGDDKTFEPGSGVNVVRAPRGFDDDEQSNMLGKGIRSVSRLCNLEVDRYPPGNGPRFPRVARTRRHGQRRGTARAKTLTHGRRSNTLATRPSRERSSCSQAAKALSVPSCRRAHTTCSDTIREAPLRHTPLSREELGREGTSADLLKEFDFGALIETTNGPSRS